MPQIKTEETTMPYHSKPKTKTKKKTTKKKKKATTGKKKSY